MPWQEEAFDALMPTKRQRGLPRAEGKPREVGV